MNIVRSSPDDYERFVYMRDFFLFSKDYTMINV
jgi:hypothetical protein